MASQSKPTRKNVKERIYRVVTNASNSESVTHDSSVINPFEEYTQGVSNPWYKDQVAIGQSATTPFLGYKYRILSANESSIRQKYTVKKGAPYYITKSIDCEGAIFSALAHQDLINLVDSVPVGSVDNEALGHIAKNIRDAQVTFQGGVAAGEFAKTMALLRNPAKSLFNAVGSYLHRIKGDARKIRRLPRKRKRDVLAETYLEATFGWTPLLYDIDDAAKALAEIANKTNLSPKSVVVGAASGTGTMNAPSVYHWPPGTSPTTFYKRYVDYLVDVKYTAYMGSSFGSVGDAQRLGFSPREFFPTLWELLPWSFVVDYFTNIGDIISAHAYANSGVLFTNKTSHSIITVSDKKLYDKWNGVGVWHTGTRKYGGASGCTLVELVRVQREKVTYPLVPSFGFTVPNSGRKWLNLAALGTLMRNTTRALL